MLSVATQTNPVIVTEIESIVKQEPLDEEMSQESPIPEPIMKLESFPENPEVDIKTITMFTS